MAAACSLAGLRFYVAGAPLVGALGLLQLVLSHHLSWRPPGWLGAAPITAQTLAVCVNALVLERSSATAALGLYLGAGLLATRVQALVPFGPKFSRATTGFVVGFVLGSWVVRWVAAALWSEEGGSGGVLFASAVASAVGQLAVLISGSLWLARALGLSARDALQAGFVPFIPGLLIKSGLAAAVAAVLALRCADAGVESST